MANIAVMLADGFEEIEGLTVVDVARRCGISVTTVSIMGRKEINGSHSIPVIADVLYEDVDFETVDMIVLPGGLKGTQNLEAFEPLMKKIDEFNSKGKYIAAICAAPSIFGHRGILKGIDACSYPSFESHLEGAKVSKEPAVQAGHVITGRGMGVSIQFALKVSEVFVGKDKVDEVARGIVFID